MKYRISRILLISCLLFGGNAGQSRAKNVILFIGDAGGIPTLNAASIHGYGAPQKLFLQGCPHRSFRYVLVGVVGHRFGGWDDRDCDRAKTTNGTLSQMPDGTPVKTILEYAEQHGLSTGVISNVNMADATRPPAIRTWIAEEVWRDLLPGMGAAFRRWRGPGVRRGPYEDLGLSRKR